MDVGQEALGRAFIEQTDLLLFYQPIHDARTGAIYGAEALLRQRRRSGEIREASLIAEAAEDSDGPELFVLDSMVMKRAFTDAAGWPAGVRLHVNLSPREFQEGDLLARLTRLLGSCRIDVQKVSLEITETSYIERPKETVHMLDALDELGVELWLDDFGTGHSSLTHLQHFPLDGIKLPGAFIRELPGDGACAAIVRAVIGLAHDLNLRVVAEEVETQDQLSFLLELGCEYVQGFLFSKPMPLEKFQATLAGRSSSGQ